MVQKIEEAGYRGMPISIKTDQEESIMALKRSIAVRRESRTAMIESKVRVSKSNPDVERAIRKWRGQFRKLKLHLEGKIDEHIPAAHTMVPWLVSWAADAILKYRVKASGKTAYEEITGHKVKHVVAAFG